MKVSGFTFVRNALRYDYPVVESIGSILPIVDEMIVAVGNSDDETRKLIEAIGSPRIKIIDTIWDDSLREGGMVLALETNKAFDAVAADADWAIYLQADEVIHEQYHRAIRTSMEQWLDHKDVEGLLFNYLHFYGSYDFTGDSPDWYRREVRVIRNDKRIRSYRDAQGFRKSGAKLKVKPADAWVYHYGWVKPPESMQAKLENFNKYWHSDRWMEENIPKTATFDYTAIDSLAHFPGTHPAVMQARIARQNWQFDFDPTKKRFSFRSRIKYMVEKLTGWRVGEYKNYRVGGL
jgi:glycosyltransferase involved in cell wall biosynthesis